MSIIRPSWDRYFLEIANVVATRSTCERKQVGCVLVRDHMILSTGYCGSIRGQPHCTDVGCLVTQQTMGGCQRTVHAEQNAITQAALHGVSTKGATAYITLSPCATCFKNLVNSGVVRIIYSEEYRVPPDKLLAESCGILMEYHLKTD